MPRFHIGVICSPSGGTQSPALSQQVHTWRQGTMCTISKHLGFFFPPLPFALCSLCRYKEVSAIHWAKQCVGSSEQHWMWQQLMGQHWIQQQLTLQQPQTHAPLALGTARSSSPFWFSTWPTRLFCSRQKSRMDFHWESSQQSDCCFGICRQSTLQAARGHCPMSSSVKRETVRINISVQNENRIFLHKVVSIRFH